MTDERLKPTIAAMRKMAKWLPAAVFALGLGGCVNVKAPDKPIVINLNINVTQQVVYRLDNSAKQLIDQNPGIF